MADFKVDPPALEQFAGTSMNRQHDFDNLHSTIQGISVPRDAFGYVPGIGGRVFDAYQEFVHGCTDWDANMWADLIGGSTGLLELSGARAVQMTVLQSADDGDTESLFEAFWRMRPTRPPA